MTARKWDQVRAFALGLPSAVEDRPWGEIVIKVDHPPRPKRNGLRRGPMFLWLGRPDSPAIAVKLKASYDQAVAVGGATATTMSGLGQWGWLTLHLADTDLDLLHDWTEESYRNVAPKKLVAELDKRRSAP